MTSILIHSGCVFGGYFLAAFLPDDDGEKSATKKGSARLADWCAGNFAVLACGEFQKLWLFLAGYVCDVSGQSFGKWRKPLCNACSVPRNVERRLNLGQCLTQWEQRCATMGAAFILRASNYTPAQRAAMSSAPTAKLTCFPENEPSQGALLVSLAFSVCCGYESTLRHLRFRSWKPASPRKLRRKSPVKSLLTASREGRRGEFFMWVSKLVWGMFAIVFEKQVMPKR